MFMVPKAPCASKHTASRSHNFILRHVAKPVTDCTDFQHFPIIDMANVVSDLAAHVHGERVDRGCLIESMATVRISRTSRPKCLNNSAMAVTQLCISVLSYRKLEHQVMNAWTVDRAKYQRATTCEYASTSQQTLHVRH